MKKILVSLLTVAMLFVFASCDDSSPAPFEANIENADQLREAIEALSTTTEPVEWRLADGVYNVQISIPAGKDVTIIGESEDGVVIAGPEDYAAMESIDIYSDDNGGDVFKGYVGIVQAKDATLTLRNLTIKGDIDKNFSMTTQNGNYCRQGGLMVINSEIDAEDVTITDTRYSDSYMGVQNGIAVYIVGEDEGKSASFNDCSITNFNKGAVVVRSTVSEFTFTNGVVEGEGATTLTAQNGIQYSCKSTITGNRISGLDYDADNEWKDGAVGVYGVNAPSGCVVTPNTFSNVNVPYYPEIGE